MGNISTNSFCLKASAQVGQYTLLKHIIFIRNLKMSQLIPPSPSIRTGSCVPRKAYGRFEFLVCDWTLMKKLPGDAINSQTFVMADDSKWILQIFAGGKTERQAGFVTTEVVLTDMGDTEEDSITATINLSVLSQRSEHAHDPDLAKLSFKSMVALEFRLDDTSRQVWAVDNFIQTLVLEQRFVLNDTVLFAVEIEVLGLPGPRKGAMPVDISTPITLQDDLSALLDNPQTSHTDITLVVEGKKFHCHKCILAARSYFFKEKLQNSTFNAKLVMSMGKYHVVDMNSSIFGHVLQYIYSDKCR
jgi:BTB/POZ domain